MIPDFKTFINESVFDDIISRSKGNDDRKEDDVNFLDKEDFQVYLKTHYVEGDIFMIAYDKTSDRLSIPITVSDEGNAMRLIYESRLRLTKKFMNTYPNIFDGTDVELDEGLFIYPQPKNGGKVTNRFVMEVIDILLAGVKKPLLEKKS